MSEDKPEYGDRKYWVLPEKFFPKDSISLTEFLERVGYNVVHSHLYFHTQPVAFLDPNGPMVLKFPDHSFPDRVFDEVKRVLDLRKILDRNEVDYVEEPSSQVALKNLRELRDSYLGKVEPLAVRLKKE